MDRPPPFTTTSWASLSCTLVLISPSGTGPLSVAYNPAARMESANNRLIFIALVIRHCTPVHRVQEHRFLTPVRLHLHVQLKEDLHAEQLFHVFTSADANLFQQCGFRPDDDALLPFALNEDGGVDARDIRSLFPTVDDHGDGMGDLLLRSVKDL